MKTGVVAARAGGFVEIPGPGFAVVLLCLVAGVNDATEPAYSVLLDENQGKHFYRAGMRVPFRFQRKIVFESCSTAGDVYYFAVAQTEAEALILSDATTPRV